jgi:predicted aspartyl protease
MTDMRHILQWDSEQFIANVGVESRLTLGIIDTGSCKTLIDEVMAEKLGL